MTGPIADAAAERLIHTGDCVEVMAQMPAASIDAIVTDPPYGLSFMAKTWDSFEAADSPMRRRPEIDAVNTGMSRQGGRQSYGDGRDFQRRQARDARTYGEWCVAWATEALRVAKPGAYLLAFGGTRTYHRLACAIEDAGWIIRDCLVWAYASGFPKSRALLKPAWEPIVMARKPGPLRELAIDACRIGYVSAADREQAIVPQPGLDSPTGNVYGFQTGEGRNGETFDPRSGRWPANVILTDPIFDGDVDGVVGGGVARPSGDYTRTVVGNREGPASIPLDGLQSARYADLGTYSRFFLIPKADRAEREPTDFQARGGGPSLTLDAELRATARRNHHPTVKPLDLMRHLVRLVTPPGGTVLDPFLGSGTTAIAAEMEGFAWIGVEKEAEYVAIAEARLQGVQRGLGLSA